MIPGRRCSPTCAIVAATRSPARAIRSISSGPLRMIIVNPAQSRLDLGEDVVDAPVRVECNERPGLPVPLDDRLCLLVVDGETTRHHLGRVVAACLVAARARACAPSPSRRRGRRRARCRAGVPISCSISSSASAWTRFRGKPSSTKPSDGVVLREPVADQRDRQLVGDELARGEDRLRPGGRAPSRPRSRRGTCRRWRREARRGRRRSASPACPFRIPAGRVRGR